MKKIIISGLALILIVVLAVASGLGYYQISELQNQMSNLQDQNSELQEQNNELQNQISELQEQNSEFLNQVIELENMIDSARDTEIRTFEWVGGYWHLGGVGLYQKFEGSIINKGVNNVTGLTLSIELFSVETNAKFAEYTRQIDVIRPGQIVDFWDYIGVGTVGSIPFYTGIGVITLTLGDVLVDEQTQNLESYMEL